MFKNYLTVAIRNLARHKVYSFINIAGLAVGMACCVLIGLYIHDELNYDRFKNADRIYRVLVEQQSGDQKNVLTNSPSALQRVLEEEFPEVETATKLAHNFTGFIRYGDKTATAPFALTEPDFYTVFYIPLIRGNREDIIQQPMSIVLSKRLAEKLFGQEDPIGKVVTLTRKAFFDGDLIVRGVMHNIADKSSLNYEILVTNFTNQLIQRGRDNGWDSWYLTSGRKTYVLLEPGTDVNALEAKLQRVIEQYMGPEVAKTMRYHLQPLPRIHLYSRADYNLRLTVDGDIQEIYLLAVVAGFILLIACINFVNLTTARSARRAQEVGLRKVVGADRFQMITQFLGEAMPMVGIALVIALGLIELSIPHFATYMAKPDLSLGAFNAPQTALLLGAFVLGVAVLAGTYPAFFLSGFKPVDTLKGTSHKTGGQWLRKGLVVTQFALSIALIVGTVVVYQQMGFLRSKRLGQDELIVTTDFFRMDSRSTADPAQWLTKKYWTIKNTILKHPDILEATATPFPVGVLNASGSTVTAEGHGDTPIVVARWNVDEDYIPFYGLELVAGRNFSPDVPSDTSRAYILNESAVKALGWQDPIGKAIQWRDRPGHVIGVVKDYHMGSMREKIGPQILIMKTDDFNYFSLKLRPGNLNKTLAFIKTTLSEFSPKPLPTSYWFQGYWFNRAYAQEMRTSTMVTTFSLLAIFLACLGLLGLTAYAAEQRTKEIGVRKVLGASVGGIMALLSRDFVRLVLIANLIAWPVAYLSATHWLQTFAYRIHLNLYPFALGTILALLIALGTVSYQAWKAARTNPIEALRYE